MRQGVLNFPFFSMQLKTADHKYTNVMETICAREDITIPPNDRHMVSMFSQLYDDTNVTGIIQPSNDLAEDGDITFCAALVTLTQGQVSIHVNNFTDQPITTPNRELCVFQEFRKIGFCDYQNVFSRNEEKVNFKVPPVGRKNSDNNISSAKMKFSRNEENVLWILYINNNI